MQDMEDQMHTFTRLSEKSTSRYIELGPIAINPRHVVVVFVSDEYTRILTTSGVLYIVKESWDEVVQALDAPDAA